MIAVAMTARAIAAMIANVGLEAKLHRMIGLYLKPKYALNDAFEVFGRIGYQKTTLRFSFDGDSGDESKSAAAYGLGASYLIDKNLYLSGSYNF